jgi:hypothetical protein
MTDTIYTTGQIIYNDEYVATVNYYNKENNQYHCECESSEIIIVNDKKLKLFTPDKCLYDYKSISEHQYVKYEIVKTSIIENHSINYTLQQYNVTPVSTTTDEHVSISYTFKPSVYYNQKYMTEQQFNQFKVAVKNDNERLKVGDKCVDNCGNYVIIKKARHNGDWMEYVCNNYCVYESANLDLYKNHIKVGDIYYDSNFVKHTISKITDKNDSFNFTIHYKSPTLSCSFSSFRTFTSIYDFQSVFYTEQQMNELKKIKTTETNERSRLNIIKKCDYDTTQNVLCIDGKKYALYEYGNITISGKKFIKLSD